MGVLRRIFRDLSPLQGRFRLFINLDFLDFEHPTCMGKSKNQPFAHTFALTGRRCLCIDTQGVALGCGLTALSGRSFSRFVRLSCAHASPLVVWLKNRVENFLDFEHLASKGSFLPQVGGAYVLKAFRRRGAVRGHRLRKGRRAWGRR